MLFFLAVTLLAFAIVALLLAERGRKASGLPRGRVVYSDTRGWSPVEAPLYDAVTGLAGRPDYLVQQGEQVIPVEVKSSRSPASPYESHIFQLAAYCRLVQAEYGRRPAYGLLHYQERTFAVDYTPELEQSLIDLLVEMKRDEHKKDVPRSHEQAGRCAKCGYRNTCDQRLTSNY